MSLLLLSGLVLVTDAVTAMGLPPGRHSLGQQVIEIQGLHAYVAGEKHILRHRIRFYVSAMDQNACEVCVQGLCKALNASFLVF